MRRRVLVVSPDLPSPPSWGFGKRVAHLVSQVAAAHDVTLLAGLHAGQDLAAGDLGRVCADVVLVPGRAPGTLERRARQAGTLLGRHAFHAREHRTREFQEALDRCLHGGSFDVVQVESSPLMSLRYDTPGAVVLDEHNVESELLQRMTTGEGSALRRAFNRREAATYRTFETAAWRSVHAIAVTSARESDEVRGRAPGTPVAVVPNGVDPAFFAPTPGTPRDPDQLVFNGLLGYRPNLDAVRFFATDVLPLVRRARPDVRLTVVGGGDEADLAAVRALGVTATGFVPDLRPYLAGAGCVVVPIRMGGGTRLKVVEALSAGAPLVSTSIGCEGIDVRHDQHLLVADTAAEQAAAVVRVLADAELRERIGRAGRALAVERYSWQHCADGLLELYDRVAPRTGVRP